MPKAQLLELSARGLALIDEAQMEFAPGLNVLTGETGAGKTLLVGALSLCLGADLPSGDVADGLRVATLWRDAAGAERVLARELSPSGRLRSVLDGQVASAEVLRDTAEDLVVIHGQRSSLRLRSRSALLPLLDQFGAVDTEALESVRTRLRAATRRRVALGGEPEARQAARELMAYQLDELRDAAITGPDELTDALAALERWQRREARRASLVEALKRLDGEDEGSALAELAHVVSLLGTVEGADRSVEQVRSALEIGRDAAHELRSLVEDDDLDASAVAALEERVGLLHRLSRKYGGSLEAALATREELERALARLDEEEREHAQLDEELRELEDQERELAASVRSARASAAERLGGDVTAQLARVALAGATVRVAVAGDDGADVRMWVRTNPGRPEGPVEEIASGGELSRLLLAVALVVTTDEAVEVFDEIDAGIGGAVAERIGECLAELAQTRQVVVVTHLATVAARADRHFVLEKEVHGGRAVTRVHEVVGDARIDEIARMLAGAGALSESRALARRLLDGQEGGPSHGGSPLD